MANELNIPEKLQGTFNRLMRKLPEELRDDERVQKTTLLFLQLGGEKLARARIKAYQTPFNEAFVFKKMQLKNDDLMELPVADDGLSDDDGADNEEDEDNDDDI